MSLNWGTVLGGTGRPRFLICGSELVANQSFEANTNGWVGSPSSDNIERILDADTFWGDYSCKITDVGAQASRSKVRSTITNTKLAGRNFALSFYVRGAAAASCSAQITALDESPAVIQKAASTSYAHYFGVFSFEASTLSSFDIDIFAVAGGSFSNSVYVDKVSCREILNDFYEEFPYAPNRNEPVYDQNIMSSGRLVDGTLREYTKGWAPTFTLAYDYMDAQLEYYRLLLSEATFIWFQPHYDYEYWVAVKWDQKFEQRYFGNIYAGHVGKISLKPIFLLESKPLSVS